MAGYDTHDFDFDLRRRIAETLWTTSGWSTVALVPGTVCGVGACFSPPYAAPQASLSVVLETEGTRITDTGTSGMDGTKLLPSGGTWRLDGVERWGTYHRRHDGRLVSLQVRSELTPMHGQPGYALVVAVRNRSDRTLSLRLLPELSAGPVGTVPLGEWGWMPPEPSAMVAERLVHGRLETGLEPSEEAVFELAVLLDGSTPHASPAQLAAESRVAAGRRTAQVLARVPRLTAELPELDEYYRRSLASGLVCLWDNPSFATVPFPATSGIDGGALCAYAWDTGGYAPHTLSLMLGRGVVDVLEAMVQADLTDHYAIAPDGAGTGVAYAYSAWSLVMLAQAAACHDGITPELVARLHETEARLADRFLTVGELRDYGAQENLLEMRSTGWEHVVASPNAERASSLDSLAGLVDQFGVPLPVDALRAQAERVREAVRRELWDATAGWFKSRYPDGHTELAYSVQAFDVLRAGVCTPSMTKAMLAQLRDGAFLAEYGVSSVSAEDRTHYELGDLDWSGGGAYTGEAPQLALTLWEQGEPRLAWDVLRRVLWMGRHFAYFPQDHFCDRPAVQQRGRRTNVIAGLTGTEAVILGLAGLRPQVNGALNLEPPTWLPTALELRGLVYRGREIDLALSAERCEVSVDGRTIHSGELAPLQILGAPDK
ncbi:MGH1-like glycoside hydrolase domain-containing protein [Kribbella sp. NPDC050124]|uniref:MGH1-like glycoside hydrolase domain-containing protein n=1 Tax=Kribbella sp. NPDC050124 TaxID=3364114 RepID=UPI0037A22C23